MQAEATEDGDVRMPPTAGDEIAARGELMPAMQAETPPAAARESSTPAAGKGSGKRPMGEPRYVASMKNNNKGKDCLHDQYGVFFRDGGGSMLPRPDGFGSQEAWETMGHATRREVAMMFMPGGVHHPDPKPEAKEAFKQKEREKMKRRGGNRTTNKAGTQEGRPAVPTARGSGDPDEQLGAAGGLPAASTNKGSGELESQAGAARGLPATSTTSGSGDPAGATGNEKGIPGVSVIEEGTERPTPAEDAGGQSCDTAHPAMPVEEWARPVLYVRRQTTAEEWV